MRLDYRSPDYFVITAGSISIVLTIAARRLDRSLSSLSPGYFALVMATGVVSIGLAEAGFGIASRTMLILAMAAYTVLSALYVARWVRFPNQVRKDQRAPEAAFGYFTVVAGTSVLAVGLLGMTPYDPIAIAFLTVAAVIWLVLGYVLPWQVLLTRDGNPILARTNGTWFVWSVASQSLAVGLAAVHPHLPQLSHLIGILAVLSWSVGTLLYAGIAVLVVLRIVHFGITAQEFEPPYWVAMGALAISVVAGVSIIDMAPTPMVDAVRALIGATVVIFWCFAAWLIPVLLGAGLWRHVVHRIPLRYSPGLWSMVFPLGMFAVASMKLGRTENMPMIEVLGTWFLWLAVLAWALVSAGLIDRLVRGSKSAA